MMEVAVSCTSNAIACIPFIGTPRRAVNLLYVDLSHRGRPLATKSFTTTRRKFSWPSISIHNSKKFLSDFSVFSPMAFGSNTSQDTDDMFDDLFEKYGKVVISRNDQKSASQEVSDNAASLYFAVALAKVASDVKAADIKVLFVGPLVYWTRFFIVATAFSYPQIGAIGTKMKDLAEKQYGKVASGDSNPNPWTLLDFGDVVVHIFLPQQRAHYKLEDFYGNATVIELPFENQQTIHS